MLLSNSSMLVRGCKVTQNNFKDNKFISMVVHGCKLSQLKIIHSYPNSYIDYSDPYVS